VSAGVLFTNVLLVIVFYFKTGGKNEKHCSIMKSSNICAISHIVVQLFEFMHGHQFHHTLEAIACLQIKQFVLLASISFLTIISFRPRIHSMTGHPHKPIKVETMKIASEVKCCLKQHKAMKK
jgi:hypothetical protein